MSNITKQIKSLLNDEALRQALTKESLQTMLDELDSNEIIIEDQEKTNEALLVNEKRLKNQLEDLRRDLTRIGKERDEGRERLGDIKTREKNALETEIRNEYEKKRGDEMLGVVGMILKNSEFRKTVFDSKPVAVEAIQYDNMGQLVSGQIVEHHRTEVTTVEKEE